jgi:hypothetical protein
MSEKKTRRPSRKSTFKKLKEGVCNISFNRLADDSERLMRCTLNMDMIPEDHWPTSAERDYNDLNEYNECRVFDLEINQWRAFRWEKLNWVKPEKNV